MKLLHEDRLFPAEATTKGIAKDLYSTIRDLPIVSPHGHTQAGWFAHNQPFPDPAKLFVQPDHYVYRMLYSQGVSLDDLEIGETLCEVLAHLGARPVGQVLPAHERDARAHINLPVLETCTNYASCATTVDPLAAQDIHLFSTARGALPLIQEALWARDETHLPPANNA